MNKTLSAVLLIALTMGLLLTGCSSFKSSSVRVGEPAPDFQLQNLSRQSVSLRNFKGKPMLINFWATWCPPCISEMPFMQAIYDNWSDKGLVVLTINVGESHARVEEFLRSRRLSLPVLLDSRGKVAKKYNVTAYPTTFFIDEKGTIREKIIGAFPSQAAIEKKLSSIIP